MIMKECPVCEKTFEDKTKPKNKKTCSPKCKRKYDIGNRRHKIELHYLFNPHLRRVTKYESYLSTSREYPYFENFKDMLSYFGSHERPFSPEAMDTIIYRQNSTHHAKRRHSEQMMSNYNGDSTEPRRFEVRGLREKDGITYEVVIKHLPSEQYEAELLEKYGEHKYKQILRRRNNFRI